MTSHQALKKKKNTKRIFIYHTKRIFLLTFLTIFLLAPADTYGQLFSKEDSFIENSGDAALVALPLSALATTLIIKDKQGSWQFTKSFFLNQAVTFTAKALINKERPLQGGDYAFPSGHTSTVFQSASFFHRRYGFKYAIPANVLAGFTGYSRMNAQRHDGWDVLAGAIVGIGSTYFFTTPYQKERMELSFSSRDNTYLLGFKYTF